MADSSRQNRALLRVETETARFYARNYVAGQLAIAKRAGDVVTARRLGAELDAIGPPVLTETLPLLPLL